jgi:pimeloyl-ACP methyl ester carboxylesterase
MIAFYDEGSGTPILWIHGFPLSSAVFEEQTRIAGARHIRPDLRGFGRTPPKRPMSMADYAGDLIELLDHLRIDRAVVAGLSMGGYIAMELVRRAPDRCSALILIDTRETPDNEEGRKGRSKTAADVEQKGTGVVIDAMLPKMVVADSAKPRAREVMESASKEGVIAALEAMATRPDSTATLRSLRVPALITVGERDAITPVADAQRMAALIPGARVVVIPDSAHLANLEKADEFNRAVSEFLRDLKSTG